MLLLQTIEQFNHEYVYFLEPIKNNIVKNGQFIRIIYSTDCVSLNGIYIAINFPFFVGNIFYNKIKCSFDPIKNEEWILKIQEIERTLLNKMKLQNKIPQYNIYEQIKNGTFKILLDDTENINEVKQIALKIAGVWETSSEFGLTYKFLTF
jgi:hypothetical protein